MILYRVQYSTNICFTVCWFAASCESSEESVVASCSSSVASASVQVCENEDEERGEGRYLPVLYVLCKFPDDIQRLLDALSLQSSYQKRIRKAICEDIAKYTL